MSVLRAGRNDQVTGRGVRYTVESLLKLLSGGMTIGEVLTACPDLERGDLFAAIESGARWDAEGATGQRLRG